MKWLVALLISIAPVLAEDQLNCKKAISQMEMTQCAALDFEKADRELNLTWPKIKNDAEASDKDSGKTEYVDALLKSQRAWLAFMDAECTWQGFEMHGGSGEPMVYYGCKARMTKQRIKQLQTGASE